MDPLVAKGLYRFFHSGDTEIVALKGVDLTVAGGEMVALVGPSGSGKSTLLSCLAGLDTPDGGVVEIMGQRLPRRSELERARMRARSIGMLMQAGNLLDHLTVQQNVDLQKYLAGRHASDGRPNVLERIGLSHRRDALPAQLSGGEASRAALAVALAVEPQILICDEPTAEVDAETEQAILSVLEGRRNDGGAVLVATHSEALAKVADRIVTIRDGRLQ
jgi:putative ABC transport system ATP-binding protein